MTVLIPVCALWALLGVDVSAALAFETSAHTTAEELKEEVVRVAEEVVGAIDNKGHSVEEAIDYQRPPLKIELPLLIFSLVLFSTFVLVMRPVVWNPLIAGLNAREERVVKAEAEARAARIQVQELTAQAEKRLAEVYSEVKSIVAQARADAEARKLEIVTQAEADAQRIKQEAISAIARARASALAELEQTVEQQVALATEHVAGRRL
ncbi:ATP synthase F0 subunit B [Planctomicrobium sp. SH661]|uniref:ATP synthase F0 subunit B n=1 Tax=Planctomicrobium sp. SH661 TaxID=3448124 RepID=UPI003F5C5A6C